MTSTHPHVVNDVLTFGFVPHLDHTSERGPVRDLAVVEFDAEIQKEVAKLRAFRYT
jgi:hypothetical protein